MTAAPAAVLPPIQLLHDSHAPCAFEMRVGPALAHADHDWPGFAPCAPTARAAPLQLEHVRERSMGSAWLADGERAFESTVGERTQAWRFPGLCELELADRHVLRWRSPPTDSRVALEAMVGAGLVLALAERDCWCLHAGAIARGGSVVGLLGASGAGKSTLARELALLPACERVADDILPLTLDDDGARAWPHFPQLKLDPREWFARERDGGLRVRALCVLRRSDTVVDVQLRTLDATEAFRALIAHTAAARALRAERLAAHMEFCRAVLSRAPVLELVVPERPHALTELARNVAEALEAIA